MTMNNEIKNFASGARRGEREIYPYSRYIIIYIIYYINILYILYYFYSSTARPVRKAFFLFSLFIVIRERKSVYGLMVGLKGIKDLSCPERKMK